MYPETFPKNLWNHHREEPIKSQAPCFGGHPASVLRALGDRSSLRHRARARGTVVYPAPCMIALPAILSPRICRIVSTGEDARFSGRQVFRVNAKRSRNSS
jgi:hypothetical protein